MHYHGCDNAGGSGNRCHAYVVPAMCVARLPLNVGKPLRALLRPWEAAQLRRPPGRGVAANAVGARRDLRALLEVREALDLVRATDVRLHPWTIPTCALSSAATCISAPCSKSVGNVDQAIKGWHLRVGIPAMKIPDHHRPPARKPCKQGWARRAGRWTAHHALRANAVNMSRRRSLPKAGAWTARAGHARGIARRLPAGGSRPMKRRLAWYAAVVVAAAFDNRRRRPAAKRASGRKHTHTCHAASRGRHKNWSHRRRIGPIRACDGGHPHDNRDRMRGSARAGSGALQPSYDKVGSSARVTTRHRQSARNQPAEHDHGHRLWPSHGQRPRHSEPRP